MSAPVFVVLAAGESRRFGGIKQLADIDGEPMLRRLLRKLLPYQCPVVVVTGSEADQVEASIAALPVHITRHPHWDEGMGSSLAAGVTFANAQFPHASGVLVCLADQPLIDAALYQQLLARHHQAPDRILVTEHEQVIGPPTLFPSNCFDALKGCAGPRGAHALIQAEWARVGRFLAADGIDVDTAMDLQQVRDRLGKTQ